MRSAIDPVTLEILRNALPAVANEMAADLKRTSYNMMIYEVCDFCTALLDKKGRLVAQNVGGVSHFVADLGVIIEDAMNCYGEAGFAEGDVIITNHQRVAGQHLNNMVIYVPIFFAGTLMGFAVTRAHWIDVGGMSTGFGAGPIIRDPWFEGLQLDQLKIYEAGVLNDTLYKVIRDNIRFPQSSLGDMRAQIAACRIAIARFVDLCAKYSPDTLLAAIDAIMDESEIRCRNAVARIPDGVYEAESFYDDDTVTPEPVRVHARVTVRGTDMVIDLSGCSAQRQGGINARTLAAARVAYKALTEPQAPVNEGAFRALTTIIPEGNMMMARFPAPMGGWSLVLPTVVDTIFKALAPGLKDELPAAHHGLLGGSVTFIGERTAEDPGFVVQSLEGGGWGATSWRDGESASVSVCQGDVRNAPIESIELRTPVIVGERSLRQDSGGPGMRRGGLGVQMRVRNLVKGKWNLARSRRQKCPPWGLAGGRPGGIAEYLLKAPEDLDFSPVDSVLRLVPEGAEVIIRTGGGGGWGPPEQRDIALVVEDVRNGWVSVEAAERHYRVVMDPETLAVDEPATQRLRCPVPA